MVLATAVVAELEADDEVTWKVKGWVAELPTPAP